VYSKKLKHTKKMKNSELLDLQTSASNQDNSNSSNENENVTKYVTLENSPFILVDIEGRWGIVFGNQLVHEQTFETVDDAKKFIDTKPWSLILSACWLYGNFINEHRDQLEQLNNTNI
jgi:hypothetical protein